MSIFNSTPIQIPSPPPAIRYNDNPQSMKNISRKKERKQRRNVSRANNRETAGEHNKSLKTKTVSEHHSVSLNNVENEIAPQPIANQDDWYRRLNDISPVVTGEEDEDFNSQPSQTVHSDSHGREAVSVPVERE